MCGTDIYTFSLLNHFFFPHNNITHTRACTQCTHVLHLHSKLIFTCVYSNYVNFICTNCLSSSKPLSYAHMHTCSRSLTKLENHYLLSCTHTHTIEVSVSFPIARTHMHTHTYISYTRLLTPTGSPKSFIIR